MGARGTAGPAGRYGGRLSPAAPHDPAPSDPPGGAAPPAEAADRTWSRHALVLLRIALPEPTPQALERVARVTRTLGAGEVLAVWSAGGWPVDDLAALDDRLRVAECRFGTGDRETFVWAAPPEPPAPAPGGVIDVRALPPPLPLVVTALAVAALPAGEAVSVTGARRSPLLADLLGGRADVSEGPPTDQGAAVTRITRR